MMYVDESGDDGLSADGVYADSLPSKVFLRTGLAFHDHKWRRFNNAFADLRYKYGIPPEVEVHATEIRRGKNRIQRGGVRTNEPNWYGLNFPKFSKRMEIIKDFCQLIADNEDITLICAIVDKTKIDRSILSERILPRNITWELLIERYNLYLQNQTDYDGIIISDAVQDSKEKKQREFARQIYRNSAHVQENHFIESILFEPSDSSNMLQLADIASYAFFKKFNNGDNKLYDIIEPRILKNDAGDINGVGLKIWP